MARPPAEDGTGGRWYKRPSLEMLVGNLSGNEYTILVDQNPALAQQLTTGLIPSEAPETAFRHHCQVLNAITSELEQLSGRERVFALRARYVAAQANWQMVRDITGCVGTAAQWIDPLLAGVDMFIAEEGW
jgi:hypothetical protein